MWGLRRCFFGMPVAEKLQSPCGARMSNDGVDGPLAGCHVLDERHLRAFAAVLMLASTA